MRRFAAILSLIALSLACTPDSGEDAFLDELYRDLPFDMPRIALPAIPDRSVSLADFGGVGDGATLNTDAFARAISELERLGGGRLQVPAGIWLTGPIGLKSHIELHVDRGALIVFSTDQDLYPIIDTNFEGLDVRRCLSPIHAEGAHDIAITGGGIIDTNAEGTKLKSLSYDRSFMTNICIGYKFSF